MEILFTIINFVFLGMIGFVFVLLLVALFGVITGRYGYSGNIFSLSDIDWSSSRMKEDLLKTLKGIGLFVISIIVWALIFFVATGGNMDFAER